MPSPTVVFVTTDPERDTPAHLRDWLDGFSPEFVGLRVPVDRFAEAFAFKGVKATLQFAER